MPIIPCPSGLELEFRPSTLDDEDRFAAANQPGHEKERDVALDRWMADLWTGTPKRGPYPSLGERRDPGDLLSGDRTCYLVQFRNDAYDPVMEIRAKCPGGHTIETEHDLRTLKTHPLPKASAEKFRRGEPFEITLPRTGRTVQWQMLTGRLEIALLQMLQEFPDHPKSEGMAVRVVAIEGFDPETGLDPESGEDMQGWIRKLPSRDGKAFQDAVIDAECSVETIIDVTCRTCGRTAPVNVLTEEGFLDVFPRRRPGLRTSRR